MGENLNIVAEYVRRASGLYRTFPCAFRKIQGGVYSMTYRLFSYNFIVNGDSLEGRLLISLRTYLRASCHRSGVNCLSASFAHIRWSSMNNRGRNQNSGDSQWQRGIGPLRSTYGKQLKMYI